MATVPARLVFEALPPGRDASPHAQQRRVEALADLSDAGVGAVNVPEIVNGHYATIDPATFAGRVQQATGLPGIVNKITVHEPLPALQSWVNATRETHGVRHVMFVGGERSTDRHPGPSLAQALPRLADAVHAHDGTVGVVTIPTRRGPGLDEPARLRAKQEAGADYAISQILMESGAASRLIDDLPAAGCTLPVLWSLAPVVQSRDVRFLEWLGVHIPADVRRDLLGAAGPRARLRASTRLAEDIAHAVAGHATAADAPFGFCVEHVMASNLEAAVGLAHTVRDVLRSDGVPLAVGPAA